jgi:hypothetical protein
MSQRSRVLIAVVVVVVLVVVVLAVDRCRRASGEPGQGVEGEPTVAPGSIPIRVDGRLVASFSPDDLEALETVSFVDDEEGKTQEGWLLRDVLRTHLDEQDLDP